MQRMFRVTTFFWAYRKHMEIGQLHKKAPSPSCDGLGAHKRRLAIKRLLVVEIRRFTGEHAIDKHGVQEDHRQHKHGTVAHNQ